VISTSPNTVIINITRQKIFNTSDVQFYVNYIGTPYNLENITQGGIDLAPILPISSTPAIGSPAGTLITVTVRGLTED
jgi:hypothetical protein